MIDRREIAELFDGPDGRIPGAISIAVMELDDASVIDLLSLIEDNERFQHRLPLRLKIYAELAKHVEKPFLSIIALLRLLRRLGSRRDLPYLGEIPDNLNDFVKYLSKRVYELIGDRPLSDAIKCLALATRSHREGDIIQMTYAAESGLAALNKIPAWTDPTESHSLEYLILMETGHELNYLAASAALRSGNSEHAFNMAYSWLEYIEKWEAAYGTLIRQRYQYFQLVGQLQDEVGLKRESLEAYSRALEYAPTRYRKAFIWLSMAQAEKSLGMLDSCWEHAIEAIEAWLDSPYPQTARQWIEWLDPVADTKEKSRKIEALRVIVRRVGVKETNKVVRAMTQLHEISAKIQDGGNLKELEAPLDQIIGELTTAGSWPNLVKILATRAVVAGRLDDPESMNKAIARAREIIEDKISPDRRPEELFFVESAHALALRDAGEYEEAFEMLFEKALESRKQYTGGIGPDEHTAFEALYYLGALAGHDPKEVEKRVKATLAAIG